LAVDDDRGRIGLMGEKGYRGDNRRQCGVFHKSGWVEQKLAVNVKCLLTIVRAGSFAFKLWLNRD
jgi:hypothetical protein